MFEGLDCVLVVYRNCLVSLVGRCPDNVFLQLGTLRELQRLYDQLVESADAGKLNLYSYSEKTGR